jgi:flagellar basal-body rod protein FlgF
MTDRLIYTAMSGATQALEQQAIVANNLANTSTTGFRAQLETFRAVPMSFGDGSTVNDQTTRTFVLSSTPGADETPGPIQQTGNPLDVAVQGDGWLSVQTADGSEAYTRGGNLHIDQNGQLVNATNLPVLGTGGPISVPPGAQITIGKDGTGAGRPRFGDRGGRPVEAGEAGSRYAHARRRRYVSHRRR